MSAFGGFGGFGANNNSNTNNTTQSSGFGGFGANNTNNTTTGGFGSGGSAFGQTANTNTGGGLFGGGAATTNTGGGFGSSTSGGFGANSNTGNTSGFGANKAFGGGSLFGGGTQQNTGSSFGGFGATANNSTTNTGGFGAAASNTGGGLFGSSNAAKPAFGSTGTTGGLFGGGNNATTTTNTGFGSGGFGGGSTLGASTDTPPGTAGTSFQAHTEKEANSSVTNSFQNILFQDPYKKWSSDELRLADYAQGRRHGNGATGGGGAFGVSSGFGGGGFGANTTTQPSTGGGLFGGSNNTTTSNTGGVFGSANNTNTSTFGQSNQTGFGAGTSNTATGGGLFGSKPAGGGLFGSGTSSQPQSTGFGTGNTGGGFGATNTTNSSAFGGGSGTTGGGLFGNANQNKPAGGLFGSSSTNNTTGGFGGNTTSAFGQNTNTTNTGGGLFGGSNTQQSNTGGGLFGGANSNTQQQNTGSAFGGFGQNQNTQQQSSGGLFGGNQQKPGGLFGSTTQQSNTGGGGGLFGNANNQQQQTNAFGGGASNTNTGGGLFGSKPAGGGVFGQPAQQNTGGGGLFGNANQQTNTGGGLFGNANNNQSNEQKPSLFGGSTTQNTGGMFGGQTNQSTGGGMFGNSTNQQNQGMGNSMLGSSQSAPQGLTANLNDVSAYGSPSLFTNVGGNEIANHGPLATPLNASSKPKRSSILPMYKLAPASASRSATPQKRGFGFSYSTYGTPGGSPASSIATTPGTAGRSLLGASSSGSLSKSVSVSNLRRSFANEESALSPAGIGTTTANGSRWYGSTGSKKLVINRDLRTDLFSTPQKERPAIEAASSQRKVVQKRVSFDTMDAGDEQPVRGALPAAEEEQDAQADETPRQNRISSGKSSSTPDVDSSMIEEEDNMATPGRRTSAGVEDLVPGEYWSVPSFDELEQLNRVQRTKVPELKVGRVNVGHVQFLHPVDISAFSVDELRGGVIVLEPRSATVYPQNHKKPPVGHGLNVPSRIKLEQAWARAGRDRKITKDNRKLAKHINKLKSMPDTHFEHYDPTTGEWTFTVDHFTTYGMDDDDDDDEDESTMPPQEEPKALTESQHLALDASMSSSIGDDTFQFRRSRGLPGAFDEPEVNMLVTDNQAAAPTESFLGVSSADPAQNDVWLSLEDEQAEPMSEGYDVSDEESTSSIAGQHLAAEHDSVSSEEDYDQEEPAKGTPGGVLRARMRALKESAGPANFEVADGDDWAEMLKKTVSPAKRDRRMLKELNDASPTRQTGLDIFAEQEAGDVDLRKSSIWKRNTTTQRKDAFAANTVGADKGRGFATSIDLMNSLFERPQPKPKTAASNLRSSVSATKGFPQFPYARHDKAIVIDEETQAFYDGGCPRWGPGETLVVPRFNGPQHMRRSLREVSDILTLHKSSIQSSHQTLRLGKFSTVSSKTLLQNQDKLTVVTLQDGVPLAQLRASSVQDVFHHRNMSDSSSLHEKRTWELASILFDEQSEPGSLRKARLSVFWKELVDQASSVLVGLAGSKEQKAVASLAGHRITDACRYLLEGQNYHLATMVPLIGAGNSAKENMREQVKGWHDSKMLSEFSDPIRAIYELLAGNPSVCDGMKNGPVEDRFESFVISKRFGLNWKQAFGLRLWYGMSQSQDPAEAIKRFAEDIDQDREDLPKPWYMEEGIDALWYDYGAHHRQDLMWGLMQIYANPSADLEAVLRPENSQLSPLDMRLTWQLGVALCATRKVNFGEKNAEKADAATISYAAQLTSAGEWLEATFVLLHLSDSSARKMAIQDHLCRHAGLIEPDSDTFALLADRYQIPSAWIWEALAIYMRSVKQDPTAEVQCLVKAGAFSESHHVLTTKVAPQAIIERDYASLAALLSQFDEHLHLVPEWHQGGSIYSLFLTLVQHRSRGETAPRSVVEKLLAGLQNEQVSGENIIRYAALSDMANETAKEIVKLTRNQQDADFRSRILKLPLTQDRLLAYSVDLGMERYREVMSH